MHYDLRYVRFEEFLDFIFDHPVAPQHCQTNWGRAAPFRVAWYDAIDLDIAFDPARNCEYLALLFCDPAVLIGRYSPSQLEQGFHWMQTSYNDGSAADILWTGSLPVERRAALVRSMYFLFADLFSAVPLHSAGRMWWENLASGIIGNVMRNRHAADRHRIEHAMFQTLSRVLQLEAEHCRIDALRGLNRLAHPKKEYLIRDYLVRRTDLDEMHRLYAERAISGELL